MKDEAPLIFEWKNNPGDFARQERNKISLVFTDSPYCRLSIEKWMATIQSVQ